MYGIPLPRPVLECDERPSRDSNDNPDDARVRWGECRGDEVDFSGDKASGIISSSSSCFVVFRVF